MKNLFSPFRHKSINELFNFRITVLFILLLIPLLVNYFGSEGSSESGSWVNIIYYSGLVAFVIFFLFFMMQLKNYFIENITRIQNLTTKLSTGIYQDRFIEIKNNDEFYNIMWQLNDVTDQFEAVMKEITTSTHYASQGKYFRKPFEVGLRGMLKDTAKTISTTLEFQEKSDVLQGMQEYLDRNTARIVKAMEEVAMGDLTVKLDAEREGDIIHKMILSFNAMNDQQKNVIYKLNDSIEATSAASFQISSSAEEMAAGAQEQSAQTSEVATAIEEMTSTILETTNNNKIAAEEATNSKIIAENGGKVFLELTKGMDSISEIVIESASIVDELGQSSEKIGEIIHVINDIADQTNLLALNAAIEAARAGEQGRGFAVVADEVRKLAERTTKATKEVEEMINKIQTETKKAVGSMHTGTEVVQTGKEKVKEAGESLNQIIISSNKVVQIINQTAEASDEQSVVVGEISRNIVGINNVAHESAQGVEQIALAAEDLSKLTQGLLDHISRFKINEGNNNYQLQRH